MRRVENLMKLIRQRDYKEIWHMSLAFLPAHLYKFYAIRRDKRYGGIAVNGRIPSKYKDLGANGTQSSDYRCMRKVFRTLPLRPDDVFIDVGCGEGRVLTYLHEKGFRGREIGIELDADVAKTATKRTAVCDNVTVCCGNALEQGELFRDATAVYMFNPFSRSVFQSFIGMLESVCRKPVRLYYLSSLHVQELENRQRWTCLYSGDVRRPCARPMPFVIYELRPDEA